MQVSRVHEGGTGEATFAGITHPDDVAQSWEQTQRLFAGEIERFEIEKRYLHKEGTVVWGRTSVQPVRDGSGRVLYSLAIIEDITGRRQAFQNLRESEAAMKSLLDATDDIAFLMDTEGTIIAANGVLARRVGKPADDLIGHNIFSLFSKGVPGFKYSWIQQVIENGKPVRLEDVPLADGYFDTSLHPVFDAEGLVDRLAVHAKDITEMKRASRALAESEAKFKQLFDHVSDGIAVRDAKTFELLDANQRFCDMWGYDLDELKAQPLGGLGADATLPERRARLIDYYSRFAKGMPKLYEWEAMRKDGSTFWVELNGTRISMGSRECFLLVVRDTTERKRAEEKIMASLREKEVLLKEIHHRVKNNLQIVSSLLYLQTTRTEHPGAVSALRESQARVKSMALIHEKLYRSPDLASIDMDSYTRSLVSDLRNSLRTEAALVRLTLNVESISLGISEAIPCGLIINELVSNSLRHAFPDGRGGEVIIQLAREDSERVTLSVSDNGVGIPEGMDIQKLPSLGLSLVHSLVEQLGGTLRVERSGGTAFTITFG